MHQLHFLGLEESMEQLSSVKPLFKVKFTVCLLVNKLSTEEEFAFSSSLP